LQTECHGINGGFWADEVGGLKIVYFSGVRTDEEASKWVTGPAPDLPEIKDFGNASLPVPMGRPHPGDHFAYSLRFHPQMFL
jgi:hypothetical protein